ncbi:Testin [Dissostichus eleginoides]|uniref:Testin n=1 Tax=Dissostichus eleginoides TaxID=100907 RepID=A0AAD9B0Q7_DISEL|nr:Testin [Dissostichus eleginoides]
MLLFVQSYKQEVLGSRRGGFTWRGWSSEEASNQRMAKEAKDRSNSDKKDALKHQDHGSTNNNISDDGSLMEQMAARRLDISAQVATVTLPWRVRLFMLSELVTMTPCECGQGLADLVYFWSNQKLLCGRHYCETVWPRCSGCDELIFSQSFHTGKDGRTWHHQHYCCWKCGQNLDTPCQH